MAALLRAVAPPCAAALTNSSFCSRAGSGGGIPSLRTISLSPESNRLSGGPSLHSRLRKIQAREHQPSSSVSLRRGVSCKAYPGEIERTYIPNPVYGETGAWIEASVQLLYLGALLVLLAAGSFLVVRQILVRNELENAAKDLQERVRAGEATSEELFELGAVMLRKKFFLLANKYLQQAINKWDGEEQDLAQVYNALGFSLFSEEKYDKAIAQYEKAVALQPGYTTAWNNLGNTYEKKKELEKALQAYETGLLYEPTNRIAMARQKDLKSKVQLLAGLVRKTD
eukprot:TRINITY_DN1269_c0_g1_i1.p1 TRINITY_DN1269_c0_g1~~TRINITY_DN1269_c0_g1_i1.p1  ORF type:complete len:284 (-),score=85.92 TRINITY_DN1269_c0_g1_i1:365-1216(-)